jgi:hypothetical protein
LRWSFRKLMLVRTVLWGAVMLHDENRVSEKYLPDMLEGC